MLSRFTKRAVAGLVALAAVGMVSVDFSHAKVGNGSSSGSRGGRTNSAPPSTNTAPKAAQPMERSATVPGTAASRPAQPAAAAAATAAQKPSMFGGMAKGLLMGGLMAGLFGSIFGFGALANTLGFIVQAVLIGGLLFLAFNFLRNRFGGRPAMATATAGARPASPERVNVHLREASPVSAGAGAAALSIEPDDFNTFERLLGEIQLAYGRSDQAALGDRVTPEMLSYFAGDLAANARKGMRNEISEPKLLQGDLSEAWREGQDEYATVAMRFSIVDRMVDVASGRVVSGNANVAQQSTELWTFRRPAKGTARQWELSGIQQTA